MEEECEDSSTIKEWTEKYRGCYAHSPRRFSTKREREAVIKRAGRAKLESKVDGLSRELSKLREVVSQQGQMLSGLLGNVGNVPLGDFEQWLESEPARKYAGMHVAFDRTSGGVIASSESLGELLLLRKELDPDKTSIVGLVPG
jgi:hypothetical protein